MLSISLTGLLTLGYGTGTVKGVTTWTHRDETYWGEPCVRVGFPLGRKWQVEADWVLRDGRPVVAELRVHVPYPVRARGPEDLASYPAEDLAPAERRLPRQGLTSTDLRGLALLGPSKALQAAWLQLAQDQGLSPLFDQAPPIKPAAKQQGRTLSDEDMARVSLDYLAACALSNSPLIHMEQQYAKGGGYWLSYQVIRDRVRLAKDRGWLKRIPGKRKGALQGPKLRAWLKRQESEGRQK